MTLEAIIAVYNEEAEIDSLIAHLYLAQVDRIIFVDDGSTDLTAPLIKDFLNKGINITYKYIDHTGLCEVARIEALKLCTEGSWVLMLDADERLDERAMDEIANFCKEPTPYRWVSFNQLEYIDGNLTREFSKIKLFKKEAVTLPEIIHREPSFTGEGVYYGWKIIHRKTSTKQVNRELEYLETYQKLLSEGKVTQSDVDWFRGMHYFAK